MESSSITSHFIEPKLNSKQFWLYSRNWDLTFLIGSVILVPIPLLLYHQFGLSQTAVNLLVAGLIGGPHLYSTFTYTFFEPNFRKEHRIFFTGSFFIPICVTVLAFVNLQVLITIFFVWASIHVLHQITYINDCYIAKRQVVRSLKNKVIDYGVVFTCLYPLAIIQILNPDFQLGGVNIYVPRWADDGLIADFQILVAFMIFGTFFLLWVNKNIIEARVGYLSVPSTLLILLTIIVGFTLPLFPNIDVAFQGFNCWHSFQYLAMIWYLNKMRKERGDLTNKLVVSCSGDSNSLRFYLLNVLLTLMAGLLVLIIHFLLSIDLQRAYYIVILSTLLQHYYLDHMQFTKLGDFIGSGKYLFTKKLTT